MIPEAFPSGSCAAATAAPDAPAADSAAADKRIDILSLSSEELGERARSLVPATAGLSAKIYSRVFKTGRLDAEAEGASAANSRLWDARFKVGLLPQVRSASEEGEAGRTVKLVFRLEDGREIESVAIPMFGGTHTLCVSSQVGCARACAFCETGRAGLTRDLSAAEIVAQVLSASLGLGVRFRNIVFMGMGEPLDNLPNVLGAIAVFGDRRGFAYSRERITVCTSGNAEGIRALGEAESSRLNLSISLNAARDELRDRLMPINRSVPLAVLRDSLAAYPKRRNFTLGINYCLIPGVNDSPADVAAVADFSRAVGRSLVNVIPYNPGRDPIGRAPEEAEVVAFIDALSGAGVPVRRRAEKGRSVMAACGQLGGIDGDRG